MCDVQILTEVASDVADWQRLLTTAAQLLIYLMGYAFLHRLMEHSVKSIFSLVDAFLPKHAASGRLLIAFALLICYLILQFKYASLFGKLLSPINGP